MIRARVFVLDPSPREERELRSHCGAQRKAFNHMLGVVKANLSQREAERSYGVPDELLTPSLSWSAYSLRKHWNSVKDEIAPWWGEVSKEAFASGCAHLAVALGSWRASRKGTYRGKPVGFPGFKGKRAVLSCTFTTGAIRIEPDGHSVTLPRLGRIHLHESARKLVRAVQREEARITQATVSYRRGRWQVSLLVHSADPAPRTRKKEIVVGVDLGVKAVLVAATAGGAEVLRVPAPVEIKRLVKARRILQRRIRNRQSPSRGVAPSRRWIKAQKRITRIDSRIANLRNEVLHQATTTLARRFKTVVVEDLNVAVMMTRAGAQKRGLNRGIASSAMATTRRYLTYKTQDAGGTVITVDRFYPSSKMCSGCGAKAKHLTLAERIYNCTTCGMGIDRDLNAAINLARMGLAGSSPVTGRGATQKTSASSGAVAAGVEASTSQSDRSQDEDSSLETAESANEAIKDLIS